VSRESVDFSTNSEKDTQLVVLALAERGLGEFEIAKELKLTRRQVQTLLWQAGKMMLVGMEVPAKENT
jgi:transcriptional regulator